MSLSIEGLDLSRLSHRKLAIVRLVRSGMGVEEAADLIPVHRNTVYKMRVRDPQFARQLDEAKRAPMRKRQQRWLAQISAGYTFNEACRRAGVSTGAACNWLRIDPDLEREYYRRVGPTGRKPGALQTLLSALRRGETMLDACAQAGYSPSTPYTWKRRRPDVWKQVAAARAAGAQRKERS